MTQKPLILSAETSSRVGSVALAAGAELLCETLFSAPLKHSLEIFPSILRLLGEFGLKSQQIEQVYISIGPGSFTGLRIATTLAKLMYLANAVKIVTLSTLDVIAANITDLTKESYNISAISSESNDSEIPKAINRIATVLDAKRGQFFVAVYEKVDNGESTVNPAIKWKKITPDSIMSPRYFLDRFSNRENPVWLLGDGLVYYRDRFQSDGIRFFEQKYWNPRASNVHKLGWEKACQNKYANPISMTPAYISRPDIKIKTL